MMQKKSTQKTLKKRLAVAVLLTFAALLVVAVASIVNDMRIGSIARQALWLQALLSERTSITEPLSFGTTPTITVKAGTVSALRTSASVDHALSLESAVIDVFVSEPLSQTDTEAPRLPSDRKVIRRGLDPIVEQLAALSFDRIVLRDATVRFVTADGASVTLTTVEAEAVFRANRPASFTARFSYLGQPMTLDAHFGEGPTYIPADPASTAAGAPPGKAVARLPLRASLKAPALKASFTGEAEIDTRLGLAGQTEVHVPDLARLAAAAGYGWSDTGTGPSLLINGPARWAGGSLSFGKSQVSLGDQQGVGAITLAVRDSRPSVEATLAFQALDVAPLLQRPSTAGQAPWRSIATAFPALTLIDGELRLSAGRLQWNGTPVGKGAVTVSARNGRVHGDLAEFSLGPHTGSLQANINETEPGGLVSLRGRFDSTDIGPLSADLFGNPLVTGAATSHFEVMGRGATLGAVLDGGYGRGGITMREGRVQLDLFALQKIAQTNAQAKVASSPPGETPAGWGAVGQQSPLDGLDIRFQLRDGSLLVEEASIRSKGLNATAKGRIGLQAADLDCIVRLGPQAPPGSVTRTIKPTPDTPAGPALAVRGNWAAPRFSSTDAPPPLP